MEFIWLIVIAFASYRITRFLVIDSLTENLRNKIHAWLANTRSQFRLVTWVANKLVELTSCTFCAGVWVTALLYSWLLGIGPWDWPREAWIGFAAAVGLQGFLHALEPESA